MKISLLSVLCVCEGMEGMSAKRIEEVKETARRMNQIPVLQSRGVVEWRCRI